MDARALRILVISPFPPRLDGLHGGSRAVAGLLAQLSVRHRVALLALRSAGEPGVDDVLREKCELVDEIDIRPVGASYADRLAHRLRLRGALLRGTPTQVAERTSPTFARRLHDLAASWQPDVVQFELRVMGQFLPALSDCPAPRVLVDHDPAAADGAMSGGVFAFLERRAWDALARQVAQRVDSIVVFTDRDRATVAGLSAVTPVVRIPLALEVHGPALDPVGTRREILYIGSFIHPPNMDAVRRLALEIFPRVKTQVPDATLRLVGSYPPPSVFELGGQGVIVAGEVPDVRPYLDAAAVVAAPIRTGGGMRVKVLEALAGGKAMVASSLAIDGLDLKDGEHVIVADTDAGFADAIVGLLVDVERRGTIARAARQWAEDNADGDARLHAYDALYSSLIAARESRSRLFVGSPSLADRLET